MVTQQHLPWAGCRPLGSKAIDRRGPDEPDSGRGQANQIVAFQENAASWIHEPHSALFLCPARTVRHQPIRSDCLRRLAPGAFVSAVPTRSEGLYCDTEVQC